MNWNKLITAYTTQTLSFELGRTALSPLPEMDDSHIRYLINAASRKNYEFLVVLGVMDKESIERISQGLRPDQKLVVSETDMAKAGNISSFLKNLPQNTAIIADTSPWAQIMLWIKTGITHTNSIVAINPALSPDQKNILKPLVTTWRKSKIINIDDNTPAMDKKIGFGAILSEHEKNLDSFFNSLPDCTNGNIVWDKQRPESSPGGNPGFTHLNRNLNNDFSAQRNAMLKGLDTDWILYLDGDERLGARLKNALPSLINMGISGFYFPRFTLFPDRAHFKAGYGLWPDLQLRLFENQAGIKFTNPVHEKIEGLTGSMAIVLDHGIIHLQHIQKKTQDLVEKLEIFNKASGNAVSHVLSNDYPNLPMESMNPEPELIRILLLPDTGQPASI